MVFTKEDLERIGNNIACIRKAYGYKTQLDFALALDPNGHYPGLSHDMIKKYESGKYQIAEKVVRLIASLTFFSFEEIVHDDLSDLEPNSLTLDGDELKDVLYSEELLKDIGETINVMFPIFKPENVCNDTNFIKAVNICEEKLNYPTIQEIDVDAACELFEQSNCPEALVNILSIIGRLYFTYVYCGIKESVLRQIQSEHFDRFIDYSKRLQNLRGYAENAEFMAQLKRKFLEKYNCGLSYYMAEAAKYNQFKDFVYYYLSIRYYIGLMDNDITKLSDSEMNSFAINMIECLDIIGNKYAKEFIKAIKE